MAVIILPIFPYKINCSHCGNHLLVEKATDITVVSNVHKKRVPGVICPSCKETVDFPAEDSERILEAFDTERMWRAR